jgi:hypothetical protein
VCETETDSIKLSTALNNQDPKAAGKGKTEMKTGDVYLMRINVEGRLYFAV